MSPSVGGYPSPHYTGGPLPSPRNRLKESLDAAGVGPMTPLGDSDSLKDRSSSHSSHQGKAEGCQRKPQQQTRRELLNKRVTDWMAGEDDRYMSMRQLGRGTDDRRFQETSFCVPDEDWIHSRVDDVSPEAASTGSVAQMEQAMT